jgi:hypothetical protein
MHLDCLRSLDSPKRFTPTSPRRSNKLCSARTFEHYNLPTIGPTRRTKQVLEKQVNHMINKENSSKNCVKNLHEATIKMILFALAMDNEEVPDDVTVSCKRFMNSKSVALAEQELN